VQVSDDQFTAHGEPSVATNPRDPHNLLAAAMVFQGTGRGVATYMSFDDGRRWTSNGLLPGVTIDYDADVTVTFDGHGDGYVSAWIGSRDHPDTGGAYLWRTDDGGRSFQPPALAVPGFLDHPGVAADPSPSSSDLYLAGTFATTAAGLRFTRSTDGGRSFEAPRTIDATNGSKGRLPVIAAGPDGLVAVMYYVAQPDGTNVATVVTSTDHGEGFGPPNVLGAVRFPSSGIAARGGPALAADHATGDLYAAVATGDPAGSSELDLYSSHDRGRTWSAATTVARTATVTYSQPQLSVDESGRVGLSAFAITSGRADQLLFISQPRTVTFGAAHRVTPTGFETARGLATATAQDSADSSSDHWIGDYQGLTASASGFHPVWNDTRTGQLELFTATVSATSP
jgi:hypothetical protein